MPSALRFGSAAVLMLALLLSCGSDQDVWSGLGARDKSTDDADEPLADVSLADATAQVRACGTGEAPAAALGFNLLAGETYAGNIVPIVTSANRCARCHAGVSNAGQPNSTTCGYLESNIDNVIIRMQNSIEAQSIKDADVIANPDPLNQLSPQQIRNRSSSGDANIDKVAERPMPPFPENANSRVTQAEIDIFVAWKDVPNKCVDSSTADPALPAVTHYSNEDEETARIAKLFEGNTCEDGPTITADRALVEPIMTLPADAASAYYDYEAKDFIAGAQKAVGNCSIDYFIAAVAAIPGAQDVLKEYKAYGWWVTQCAVVNGRPQAYLAHVARVTSVLGDRTYGVFLKPLRIKG